MLLPSNHSSKKTFAITWADPLLYMLIRAHFFFKFFYLFIFLNYLESVRLLGLEGVGDDALPRHAPPDEAAHACSGVCAHGVSSGESDDNGEYKIHPPSINQQQKQKQKKPNQSQNNPVLRAHIHHRSTNNHIHIAPFGPSTASCRSRSMAIRMKTLPRYCGCSTSLSCFPTDLTDLTMGTSTCVFMVLMGRACA